MPKKSTEWTCDTCGDPLEIGSWPMCRGKGSHQSTLGRYAQSIAPIPYYEHPDRPGDIWHVNEDRPNERPPADSGYVRKEARTIREIADRDRRESAHHNFKQQLVDEQRTPIRAESMRRSVERLQELKKRDPKWAGIVDLAIADNRAPLRHDKPIEIMTQILHYDQSNREAYRDGDGKLRRD